MIRVKNKKCIRHLGFQSMKTAKTRNWVAVIAIALTAILFTSLFTIAVSINDSFQQANFRQVGSYSHGEFKCLTEEQFEELKNDPLIKKWGMRRFLGMPLQEPFQKSHVEISYCNANTAHWMYCDPIEGRLPQEGTNEAATDLKILELLGVKPEIGAEFTVTFDVDGHETTQTFTLCGWWEYDEMIIANHILIPESRVNEILQQVHVTPPGTNQTGTWTLDVMLSNAMHIENDLNTILSNHGYQSEGYAAGDNYIDIGVNWGYTGTQLFENMDLQAVTAMAVFLLLIIFTGYLIIYNIFQISVANDIRFYGLLKTIGTTGKQIKHIVRQQALLLSVIGIPLGLVIGWLIGSILTPIVLSHLSAVVPDFVSANPVIFVISAVFALATVLISCHKPCRVAAKVSPTEALRYSEVSSKKKWKRSGKGISLFSMAKSNLGRTRGKTCITILSLALAAVLLNVTVIFLNSFDMDKYLRDIVCDFIAADAGYFQSDGVGFNKDEAVPENTIAEINAQGGVADSGRIYGLPFRALEFVTEEYYRSMWSKWFDEDTLDLVVQSKERSEDGLLAIDVQLYGMERYALDKCTVVEGDISKVYEPNTNYIAAVTGIIDPWAQVGDTVKIRYVEEWEYYDTETGKVYEGNQPENQPNVIQRAAKYYDKEYTVAALVTVPHSISYRYSGTDEFILNDQTFIQDTGTDTIMLYAYDMADEKSKSKMDTFLSDYTNNQNPDLDYESKLTHEQEFESLRSMFLMLGGALSFIIALVGILNFFNAILTGIITRKREFAVLQSIGMTGKQLKGMLIWEGLFYALGAVLLALILAVIVSPLINSAISSLYWFISYHFTVIPILILIPFFALLGCLVPLGVYHFMAKATVVERLRETE